MACLRHGHFVRHFSSRFPVIAASAAVVSDELLASQAGLDVLRRGGNAADAALAMSVCMQVLEPYTTGVGGDCFALYYDSRTKKVHCVDGSGRSPADLTLEQVQCHSRVEGPLLKRAVGLYATVPGAPKAWFYIARRFGSGKLSLSEIFDPAIHCAEHGFPMDHSKQAVWTFQHKYLQKNPGGLSLLDKGGQIPSLGQIITNRPLADLLRESGKGLPGNGSTLRTVGHHFFGCS
ncbi:glutathione hydrolase-like YwrD proenzyme [Amblyomma americanum]